MRAQINRRKIVKLLGANNELANVLGSFDCLAKRTKQRGLAAPG